jgi:hypothetical protein
MYAVLSISINALSATRFPEIWRGNGGEALERPASAFWPRGGGRINRVVLGVDNAVHPA